MPGIDTSRYDRQPGPLHQPDPPRTRRAPLDGRGVRHAVGRCRREDSRGSRRRGRRGDREHAQDQLTVNANSSRPFEMPDYDTTSQDATRNAVLELAKHLGSFDHAFGTKLDVDPVRHLIATAAAGVDFLTARPATSASSRAFPSANTSSPCETSPSMRSGQSRSTTPKASSRQTIATPTASTTSPRPQTTTARSPSTSAVAATIGTTACRSWTAGTTRSGSTDPARGARRLLGIPDHRAGLNSATVTRAGARSRSDRNQQPHARRLVQHQQGAFLATRPASSLLAR